MSNATSLLFDLPGFVVVDGPHDTGDGRSVVIMTALSCVKIPGRGC